ncbi:MAG: hypothetical protein A2020_02265 [Lentisphaerae bacterium GWF2_45_14]|nr:MAG: hypothetical protein A2020_02265 [Lentisphaerae bacterium GWF2_45_14]
MDFRQEDHKRQSYWRLLKYVAPYKFRLSIGIFAGVVVGGSMFGTFMVIPSLLEGVVNKSSEIENRKLASVTKKDNIEEGKPKPYLSKELEKIKKYSEMLKLPVEVFQRSVKIKEPVEINVPVEDEFGNMTWQYLSIYAVLISLGWMIKNIFEYINRYYTRWVGTKVIADLRNAVFKRLLNQSLRFYGSMDIGGLISRCTNDTAAIESAVASTIADITMCPLQILSCLLAIIVVCVHYQNYFLLVILALGVPVCVIPVVIMGRSIRKVYKSAFSKIADVVSRMHEVFTGILIVKAYHMEKREFNKFAEINRRYFRTVVHALKLQLLMAPLMETVAITATLGFLIYCMFYKITLIELGAMLFPAFMAYKPIKEIAKITTYVQRSMAAADRYFALLDTDTAIKEKADAIELKSFDRRISFQNVTFSYDGQRNILDGVTFDIKKGAVVAVVGETGSGKTTIANLIARFYDVSSGSLTIDGTDVRDFKIDSLRDHIGIITQDAILFNETIADNISYGRPDASEEEIVEAAKKANAHQFITDGRHQDGYQTIVGDKGCKLSGGEKQRISIARAIIKNPQILILDEATSALDTVTEKLVQESLNRAMENRTVFAIAHRLSTIKHANMIIVLEKGRIVEKGTHEELMEKEGPYKKLHDTQFGIT